MIIKIRLILLFLIASSNALAQDSPLSPALVLKPQQLLSNTELGYSKMQLNPYSTFAGLKLSSTDDVSGVLAYQSLRLGLNDNVEVGISETYSDVDDTRFSRIRVLDGFSNPTIAARKTWWSDSPVRLSLFGSVTPKLADHGLRGINTRYAFGGSGAFITPSGLVTQLGITRRVTDGDSVNSSVVSVAAYKEFCGIYSLSFGATFQLFDSSSPRVFVEPESIQGFSVGLGRKLTERAWGQVYYEYSDSDYQEKPLSFFRAGLSTDTTTIGASLRYFF